MEPNEVQSSYTPGQEEVKAVNVSPKDLEDVDNCTKEVMTALQKYGCDIAVAFLITAGGNEPRVQIVKKNL